jgi:hypothetical protein
MPPSELVKMRTDFTAAVAKLVLEGLRQGVLVALNEAKRSDEQAIVNAYGELGRQRIKSCLAVGGFADLGIAIGNNGAANGIRNSLHEVGLAVDLLLYTPEGLYLTIGASYTQLGEWWEGQDMRAAWGGRFGDPGHFSFAWQGKR